MARSMVLGIMQRMARSVARSIRQGAARIGYKIADDHPRDLRRVVNKGYSRGQSAMGEALPVRFAFAVCFA